MYSLEDNLLEFRFCLTTESEWNSCFDCILWVGGAELDYDKMGTRAGFGGLGSCLNKF